MTLTYTNWEGKQKTWDPEAPSTRHYILVDGAVTDNATGSRFGERVFHCFGPSITVDLLSAASVAAGFRRFAAQYPHHNWNENHPRIVKAPCAWDAPQNHVVVEEVSDVR